MAFKEEFRVAFFVCDLCHPQKESMCLFVGGWGWVCKSCIDQGTELFYRERKKQREAHLSEGRKTP